MSANEIILLVIYCKELTGSSFKLNIEEIIMKKILSFLQRNAVAAISVIAMGVLLPSCLKDDDNQPVDIPAAGLMAFNLAPDQQSVAIRLSGSSLTQSPLAYTNFTGIYQRI